MGNITCHSLTKLQKPFKYIVTCVIMQVLVLTKMKNQCCSHLLLCRKMVLDCTLPLPATGITRQMVWLEHFAGPQFTTRILFHRKLHGEVGEQDNVLHCFRLRSSNLRQVICCITNLCILCLSSFSFCFLTSFLISYTHAPFLQFVIKMLIFSINQVAQFDKNAFDSTSVLASILPILPVAPA